MNYLIFFFFAVFVSCAVYCHLFVVFVHYVVSGTGHLAGHSSPSNTRNWLNRIIIRGPYIMSHICLDSKCS